MRENEVQLILKWIGFNLHGGYITEAMLRDAIKYAYEMGFTDGRQ